MNQIALSVMDCQLLEKVALSGPVVVNFRFFIDETNIRVLLVCHCQLQKGGSGERERFFCFYTSLMYFLKIFRGVGC